MFYYAWYSYIFRIFCIIVHFLGNDLIRLMSQYVLIRWTLYSLLIWHKFDKRQHQYTLLRRGIKVCGHWETDVHCCVSYELTHTLRLNNTDIVRDISSVASGVLMCLNMHNIWHLCSIFIYTKSVFFIRSYSRIICSLICSNHKYWRYVPVCFMYVIVALRVLNIWCLGIHPTVWACMP